MTAVDEIPEADLRPTQGGRVGQETVRELKALRRSGVDPRALHVRTIPEPGAESEEPEPEPESAKAIEPRRRPKRTNSSPRLDEDWENCIQALEKLVKAQERVVAIEAGKLLRYRNALSALLHGVPEKDR